MGFLALQVDLDDSVRKDDINGSRPGKADVRVIVTKESERAVTIRRCIYCGTAGGKLSEEHVTPFGLVRRQADALARRLHPLPGHHENPQDPLQKLGISQARNAVGIQSANLPALTV